MWWLDPGKEVLNVLFNRILAPYVENLDMGQVNYGIGQGQITLRNLRLKKGALDKFRLPVDVLEGHLGKFTLSLHWLNLGNQPVEVMIEDVYLLVVPSPQANVDPKEEEDRVQATKAERLENAELLHMKGAEVGEMSADNSPQSQGLWASLTAKIINNLQVTVKNIHVRYEDKLSVPGHPFAAGITLAGFTAVSVNDKWEPAFIESNAGAIHKLANLQSLAVYFNTDSPSMAGLPLAEAKIKFSELISQGNHVPEHQFILKPVSGEGRIIMNHVSTKDTPRFDVQLLFDEIGVVLDDNQYRDAISLLDMYHVYVRQHQYRKFKPAEEVFKANRPKALLQFATTAILEGVKERKRQWTWAYFAERRDDRNIYVELFKGKLLGPQTPQDLQIFQALEKKLSYEDIRFYRSIARSQARKDAAMRLKIEQEKKKQEQPKSTGWTGWLWGSSSTSQNQEDPAFSGTMTEEQRKQLYDVLEYDEKAALADSFQAPRDSLKARIAAKLDKGSFALRTGPKQSEEVVSVVFDVFQANVIQRPDNLEASVSLGGFGVFDGTTPNTLYHQIVQVKENARSNGRVETQVIEPKPIMDIDDPFFFVKFENNPLDERSDSALTVRMRHMEIIYHKGYVEAVVRFFKPPESQLESVEALLSAASQTFEDLRKETRIGLEYALQTHKTVDIQMDLNAPVIIIPEDVTTKKCKHLLIDAGHISIESDLADKQAVQEIHQKRNQQYTDDDYKRLESLMYDKLSLKLEAAQFLVGNDLQSCREALTSDAGDSLHLLERINIELQVQNSIVPTAYSLPRFKVAGKLPSLHVNLSDTKYQSLMRLIDVCIPNFDQGDSAPPPPPPTDRHTTPAFQGLFGQKGIEYTIDDHEDNGHEEAAERQSIASSDQPEILQQVFVLDFKVDSLLATLSKTDGAGIERTLGDASFDNFALGFSMTKYIMKVNVKLRSISMNIIQPDREPIKFMSSTEAGANNDRDLLAVKYTRAQQASPDFLTVYEGIDQSIDAQISTVILRAAPEPILTLYDFIMTTFVPKSAPAPESEDLKTSVADQSAADIQANASPAAPSAIRVMAKLESVQVILVNEDTSLATLSLSTANVAILLRGNTMSIVGRLGSLALSNDSPAPVAQPEFNEIMSIEGNNFAEFKYQTFDPSDDGYKGIKSAVSLNTASVKLYFLEQPLHDIYLFLIKLARLKGLYDAATTVAVQRASEIERMQFEITVKSPIVIFPSDTAKSKDVLVMRLGEISAHNTYDDTVNKIIASLRGIQLVSRIYHSDEPSVLKIIDDIDITSDIVQTSGINRGRDLDYPDTQVAVKISDVKLQLTQIQYGLLMGLSQAIPRVLAGAPEGNAQAASVTSPAIKSPAPSDLNVSAVDLEPELRAVTEGATRIWTTLDLVVSISAVKLRLFDGQASMEETLKDHGIARFALNDSTLRFKMLSDGAGEAQIVLKSFTMGNTRPGNSKFREIIPAAQHDRNQFMILYTMSGGSSGSSLAILTIDSPQVIFAIEPVIALLNFFTSAFSTPNATNQLNAQTSQVDLQTVNPETPPSQSRLDFRVDLHDVSISILENDADADSQAIRLSINQILLSQQGILAITVNRLGMALMRMGNAADTVRFLDEIDITFSLDSRNSTQENMTSMEIAVKPVVFRASYGDINLIMAIVNRALELYGKSASASTGSESNIPAISGAVSKSDAPASTTSQSHPSGKARAVMSKEQLQCAFDGFRFVLIGDLHEQPMLHLRVKPFNIGAKDWSGNLQANTTMATHISYWNLTNSHWEPLIDPWTFSFRVLKDGPTGGMKATISSRERLDLNISTTFTELAITTVNLLGKKDQALSKARGSYAPYRIQNRTGSTILIWSDTDGNGNANDGATVTVVNDETVDWRFDDWKTMREHVPSSGQHGIAIQFVGKPWELLRGVPVDREGEFTFSLRPRTEKYANRLLCEVKVQENVKVVVIRSTYQIQNDTLYPLELTLIDDVGHPVSSLEKIGPGQSYPLPIEAVTKNRIRLQPDQGFGYKWCTAIRFEDLVAKKSFTIKCPHSDAKEAAFRFQAWVQTDTKDAINKSPKVTLRLRAPIELENLLPYNLQYRIYDKDADQNWKSYLRKGGIMPVHSVELGHLVLLNVEVQDTVFKPSDFAIINTDGRSDFDIENKLTLRDPKGRKLNLRLNYVRYPDSGGAFRVQVYSPYLVVNKTGVPFAVRSTRSSRANPPQDTAGEIQPEILSRPAPYMLSHPHENSHEFVLRVGDSQWSKMFSFEAPSAETELVAASQREKSQEWHVGVSWTEGLGKYKLTKVITLAPRFLVKNSLSEPLVFREHGVAPKDRSVLEPGQRVPLQNLRAAQERLLTVAFPGLNAQWSAPINIEDIGSVHFRMYGRDSTDVQLVRADVQIDGPTIFVTFSKAEEGWPFVIENDSDYTFSIAQTDGNQQQDSSKTKSAYTLTPRSHLDYAWDSPAARDKKLSLLFKDSRRLVDPMEIGDLVPFKFRDDDRTRAVSLDVRADGHKQVLRITNYVAERSVYKPKRRDTTGLKRSDTAISSAEAFEAITEEIPPTFSFDVDFAGIGLSLVNRKMVEVIYLTVNDLKFEYNDSPVAQAVSLSCGALEIDNQLHEALYPVILQPTPIPKEATGVAALPTVQGSIIWLKDQEHGVMFIKYCSILLQALTIEADEDLLFAVYDLTKLKGVSWVDESQDILIQHPEEIPEPQAVAAGQALYFEVLELQPIKLSLSFMRTERVNSDEKLSVRNPLAVVVNALTMTVGNINDAPIELNALAIKDMRLTMPELQGRIIYHYRQDVLRQVYRILGSADFLGNPVGLFTNVSSGVADIFYEPFNGVVMHGNKELGIGIAKGAASFVKKTVFGLSDSVTKFTSSVGKGLSAATFDSEYQAKRRMAQRRNRPRHAIYGVTAGGEALASSVASAFEGVVMKPIEGAESGGAFGFFKGVGQGLVGAVTKPAVGFFDLASNVSEGIRNTTTVFDNPERDRVRLPRHIPSDGVLAPYSPREAMGQYWMKDLDNGTYASESYVAHINTPGGDNVVLLTNSRVLSLWSKKLKLEWDLPFTYVQGVTVEDTGIRFAHKAGKDHDKFVFVPDKSSQSWFFGEVATVVKNFNTQRRMNS